MLKKDKKKINIIVSPHRDDAFLTFGGLILKAIKQKEEVIILLVYGLDGSLREEFLLNLKNKHIKTFNYIRRIKEIANHPLFSENIFELIKNSKTDKDWFKVGILIRRLEDAALAKKLGLRIIEYNLPAAFPLRGYKTFNSSKSTIFPDDINFQLSLLLGKKSLNPYYLLKLKNIFFEKNISSLFQPRASLYETLNRLLVSKSNNYYFYFPSGIGGHPDHIILAKFGYRFFMEKKREKNIFFSLGQDLPYATVLEWFNYSPFKLYKFKKEVINIENEIEDKFSLLKSFYFSQLSYLDLIRIKNYHKMYARILNYNYLWKGKKNRKHKAVEIVYNLKI